VAFVGLPAADEVPTAAARSNARNIHTGTGQKERGMTHAKKAVLVGAAAIFAAKVWAAVNGVAEPEARLQSGVFRHGENVELNPRVESTDPTCHGPMSAGSLLREVGDRSGGFDQTSPEGLMPAVVEPCACSNLGGDRVLIFGLIVALALWNWLGGLTASFVPFGPIVWRALNRAKASDDEHAIRAYLRWLAANHLWNHFVTVTGSLLLSWGAADGAGGLAWVPWLIFAAYFLSMRLGHIIDAFSRLVRADAMPAASSM